MAIKTISFRERDFKQLEQLDLENGVISTECQLFIYNDHGVPKLLKKFFYSEGSYFANKMLTLSLLIDKGQYLGIDHLVLPEKLLVVDDIVCGYMMDFVSPSTNVGVLLSNERIPWVVKLQFLKEMAMFVSKAVYMFPRTSFLFGDLHEYNFIRNNLDGKIYAVDMDGCKIENNMVFNMKYCDGDYSLSTLRDKYPLNADGRFMPNVNTELLCFSYMVLNSLAGCNVANFNFDRFYSYLSILADCGMPNVFLDCFSNLFTGKNNVFPFEEMDALREVNGDTSYKRLLVKKSS